MDAMILRDRNNDASSDLEERLYVQHDANGNRLYPDNLFETPPNPNFAFNGLPGFSGRNLASRNATPCTSTSTTATPAKGKISTSRRDACRVRGKGEAAIPGRELV